MNPTGCISTCYRVDIHPPVPSTFLAAVAMTGPATLIHGDRAAWGRVATVTPGPPNTSKLVVLLHAEGDTLGWSVISCIDPIVAENTVAC